MNDRELETAVERLHEKMLLARREHPEIGLGESCETLPANGAETALHPEWTRLLEPEKTEFEDVLRRRLSALPRPDASRLPRLGDDNLWLWGGPTPYWGGVMDDDTLVRGAEYFGIKNGVYVYGPTNEKMLKLHSGFQKLLCQVNSMCRTPGAQEGRNDSENAEELSRLSLRFPNVTGAMCDDVTTRFSGRVPGAAFQKRSAALKKHNPNLKMYGVIYVHELEQKDFSAILPHLDVVTLWFWHMEEILEYDRHIENCRKAFPGKSILQGIFLHDYGRIDAGVMPELLTYQLTKSREYMALGAVEGVVLLGDREIRKWPDTASAVRTYLRNQ